MDGPPINSKQPISPISQLLQNLGMTRDDLTRHSDQMRQFLTAENANSLRAFSNAADSDADSATSPTVPSQPGRAKSRSISAADAPISLPPPPPPPPCSFPPATPIKTEPVEPSVSSSSVRRFESMDEIIERQNRRTRRERRSRRERDTSPGALSHSPTRSSLRTSSGHPRTASTRNSGRVRIADDSLPANLALSQVSRTPARS